MIEANSKLALAMSKAQGMIEGAKKDVTNTFFKAKYADLASVWNACRSALSQNELAVIQIPEIRDGILGIRTKLIHSSGEFEEGFFPIAASISDKAQIMGSAITYARRYALAAMVGVAPEEDDGQAANNASHNPMQKVNPHLKAIQAKAIDFATVLDNAASLKQVNEIVDNHADLFKQLHADLPEWYDRLGKHIAKKQEAFQLAAE
jgi:ERF superfamily